LANTPSATGLWHIVDGGDGLEKDLQKINEKIKGNCLLLNLGLTKKDSGRRNLHRAEKISLSDPVFLLARKMNANAKLSYDDQVYLKFFLASIYESSKNQELFFKFLSEGSEIKKVVSNYSNKESAELFNKIQSIYIKHMPELKEPIKEIEKTKKEIKPIFIVGMPRSGTSLLEQILSNHPLVFGAGEVNTLHSSFLNLFSNSGKVV
jgi:hypothetical protein